jgi:glucose/arabinose dehydrogenase
MSANFFHRAVLPLTSVATLLAWAGGLSGCKRETHGYQAGSGSPRALQGDPAFTPAFGTDKGNAFRFPVWFGEIPGKSEAYLVLERGTGDEDAHAWVLSKEGEGYVRKTFLTVPVQTTSSPSDERGLLGWAFHPRYRENRKYYVYYFRKRPAPIAGSSEARDSTVIEERLADSTLLGDAGAPPRRVFAVEQPYPNHNGGNIAFGPRDGRLYVGTGDGGSGGDPHGNGQNVHTWLGKVLRIDVDDSAARPEVWAYGLRNPWRWSFDSLTGDLWAGDVGQNTHEEIDRISRGDNLGWNRMEGDACFAPPQGCDTAGLKLPEATLDRREAECITGGYVYRGDTASSYYGAYLFGDFATRNFFALPPGHKTGDPAVKLGRLPDQPSSFGVDARGRLYLVGYSTGIIYRVSLP